MQTPSLYQFFLAMREEIDRHKWIESEKRGYDVGLEFAMIDWVLRYKTGWKHKYMLSLQQSASLQKNS